MQTAESLLRDAQQLQSTATRIAHEAGTTCSDCANNDPAGLSLEIFDPATLRRTIEETVAPGFDRERHRISIRLTTDAILLDVR